MLRLTEIKLPLDHPADAIQAAVLKRLKIDVASLMSFTIFRRGYDARKRSEILLVYTLDVEVKNEAALLKRFEGDAKLGVTPDTTYKFVAHAPTTLPSRPVVIV